MQVEFGHKDVLEYLLLGTGQDTVGGAMKFIDENGYWDDVVRAMNDARRWTINVKSSKSDLVEMMQHYSSITVADIT